MTLLIPTCFIILYDDNCHFIFLNSSTNVSCAKNVSMCWIILLMQVIYASENTARQWNSWNAYKRSELTFKRNKEGTSSSVSVFGLVWFWDEQREFWYCRSDLYYSMWTVPPYGHTQWLLTSRESYQCDGLSVTDLLYWFVVFLVL